MPLVVQKYGGSSLKDAKRIKVAAQRIGATKDKGYQVVAICSAMGDTTDELLQLASKVSNRPNEREMDLLLSTGEVVSCTIMAMALHSLGYPAVSLTGAQAGIYTDAAHGKAKIARVDPQRVVKELDQGNIVIVAGFQGISADMDITTLGRGGSDVTAVALAAALKAERCEIYTDVEGIYTADPRLVPQARKLPQIGYEEMMEMAMYGAKMQPRSIELAAVYNIHILVASSFSNKPGTLIDGDANMEMKNRVRGVTYDVNVAKVTLLGVSDRPGIASAIFEPLANAGISVDTIVQNASVERLTDVTFTVSRSDLKKSLEVIEPVAHNIGVREVISADKLGKVSIVGTGMQNTPGYAARMFTTLAHHGINIEMITTSEIRITCIIAEDMVKDAVRALHQAFQLDQAD